MEVRESKLRGEWRKLHNMNFIIQGGSNMTGTDLMCKHIKSVPVIFEPPCIQGVTGGMDQTSGECSLGQTILI